MPKQDQLTLAEARAEFNALVKAFKDYVGKTKHLEVEARSFLITRVDGKNWIETGRAADGLDVPALMDVTGAMMLAIGYSKQEVGINFRNFADSFVAAGNDVELAPAIDSIIARAVGQLVAVFANAYYRGGGEKTLLDVLGGGQKVGDALFHAMNRAVNDVIKKRPAPSKGNRRGLMR
jgi:hypothetical protein